MYKRVAGNARHISQQNICSVVSSLRLYNRSKYEFDKPVLLQVSGLLIERSNSSFHHEKYLLLVSTLLFSQQTKSWSVCTLLFRLMCEDPWTVFSSKSYSFPCIFCEDTREFVSVSYRREQCMLVWFLRKNYNISIQFSIWTFQWIADRNQLEV